MSTALAPEIDDALSRIRETYHLYFDRSWLDNAIADLPDEERILKDIRHALSLVSPTTWDIPLLHRGVAALKSYTGLIRHSLMPRAREFTRNQDSADARLRRRLAVYTLPTNLERLDMQIRELESLLPLGEYRRGLSYALSV